VIHQINVAAQRPSVRLSSSVGWCYCDPQQHTKRFFVTMHQPTADSASVGEARSETSIKSTAAARQSSTTELVSTIMDKYILADPWPAKNEKVCSDGSLDN
jgi:hypothetical protein